MPQRGKIMTDPKTGDTIEFLETAASTNGEKVVLKATFKSTGAAVPKHAHILQEESFEMVSGELTLWTDGKWAVLKPGEKITFPKDTLHNHYNSNPTVPAVYYHTVTPALDFDYFIENLMGLIIDGKRKKDGTFGMLQELTTLKYIDSKARIRGLPVIVQSVLTNTIAPVARAMGYRALYKQYTGIEK